VICDAEGVPSTATMTKHRPLKRTAELQISLITLLLREATEDRTKCLTDIPDAEVGTLFSAHLPNSHR